MQMSRVGIPLKIIFLINFRSQRLKDVAALSKGHARAEAKSCFCDLVLVLVRIKRVKFKTMKYFKHYQVEEAYTSKTENPFPELTIVHISFEEGFTDDFEDEPTETYKYTFSDGSILKKSRDKCIKQGWKRPWSNWSYHWIMEPKTED